MQFSYAISILIGAFHMLWTNRLQALKISLIPWVLALLTIYFAENVMHGSFIEIPDNLSTVGEVLSLILSAATSVFFIWIAVAWHRLILLEEPCEAVIPTWHGQNIKAYLIQCLWLGLFILALVVVMGLTLLLLHLLSSSTWVIGLLSFFKKSAFVVCAYAIYRFCLILPSAALGRTMGLRASWRQTKPVRYALAVIAVIMSLPDIIDPFSFLDGFIYQVVWMIFAYLLFIYGLCIVTTLYGHLVEERALT